MEGVAAGVPGAAEAAWEAAAGAGAWFAVLCVIGVGCGVAWLGLRAAGLRDRRLGLHTAAFGPGLGLGIASLLTFFCRTFGLPRPGLGSLLAAGALLAAAIAGMEARRRRRSVREEISPPALPVRFPVFVRAVALLMLLVSTGLFLDTLRMVSRTWPEGTWDAVAVWNVRARFLDRDYERAPELLKKVDPVSHPNYPLLVPGAVAAQLAIAGEDPWVSRLTGMVFAVGAGLLVFAVVADSGSLALAAIATALLWGSPMFLKWAGSQCADIPVAYYFLGALAVLGSRLPGRRDGPLPLVLGGVFLGLLAWTKNEGVVMVLLLAGLYGLWRLLDRRASPGKESLGREALALGLGLLPGLLAVLLFKALWAPESGLGTFFQGHAHHGTALDRILSPVRWWVPVREVVKRLVPLGDGATWSLAWPALLAGVGLAVWAQLRFRHAWASFWGACLLLTVASWIPIFAVTPYGQMWHILGSIDRLYLQVFPALIAGLFLRLGWALREKVRGPVQVREVPVGALWLAGVVAAGLALKALLVAEAFPRIWLFMDELLYLMTAYDIAHWGEAGVPHPDAFFYAPLPSLLIAPLFALGLKPPLVYHAALLLFHGLLTSAAVAGWLTLRRLFGTESRLLPVLLVLGPPAYTALALMSEPLFIALYSWFLYFLVRMNQERRSWTAWVAGFLLAGLVLTRFAGYLAAVSLAVGALDAFLRHRQRKDWKLLGLHLQALVPPVAAFVAWRLIAPNVKTAPPMDDPLVLLAVALNFPLELALGAARRFLAQVGYVSLSTFGFALPAAVWLLVRRATPDEVRGEAPDGRREEIRLFLVNVFGFLAGACFIASVFMWYGAIRLPLPRFDMYGRYVEYFAVPLLIVALGSLGLLRERPRARLAVVAGALLLNAVLLLFIPAGFFTASLDNQVAPNSLGIAWFFRIVGRYGTWTRWLLPVLAAALAWGLTSRGRLRHAAAGALLLLVAFNFGIATQESSLNSVGSATYASAVSDFVLAHPEAFAGGIYVDYPEYLRDDGPVTDFASIDRVIADHLDKVIAGREPERYAGKMPVLTWRRLNRPVLAEWPHLTYRIYAADPPAPGSAPIPPVSAP